MVGQPKGEWKVAVVVLQAKTKNKNLKNRNLTMEDIVERVLKHQDRDTNAFSNTAEIQQIIIDHAFLKLSNMESQNNTFDYTEASQDALEDVIGNEFSANPKPVERFCKKLKLELDPILRRYYARAHLPIKTALQV